MPPSDLASQVIFQGYVLDVGRPASNEVFVTNIPLGKEVDYAYPFKSKATFEEALKWVYHRKLVAINKFRSNFEKGLAAGWATCGRVFTLSDKDMPVLYGNTKLIKGLELRDFARLYPESIPIDDIQELEDIVSSSTAQKKIHQMTQAREEEEEEEEVVPLDDEEEPIEKEPVKPAPPPAVSKKFGAPAAPSKFSIKKTPQVSSAVKKPPSILKEKEDIFE